MRHSSQELLALPGQGAGVGTVQSGRRRAARTISPSRIVAADVRACCPKPFDSPHVTLCAPPNISKTQPNLTIAQAHGAHAPYLLRIWATRPRGGFNISPE